MTTVCLLMVLAQTLKLKNIQVYYAQAFTQAELDEDVYMNIPSGFHYRYLYTSNKICHETEVKYLWFEIG